jgi:cell volume regulation protein A
LLAGVPDAKLLFNVAFVVVLSSLLLQGASVPFAARRFSVGLPPRDEPSVRPTLSNDQLAVLEFPVGDRSSLAGVQLDSLIFPKGVRVIGVVREARLLSGLEAGQLQPKDVVMMIAPDEEVDHLSEMFTRVEASVRRAAWGDFVLDGSANFADVCGAYGCEAPLEYRAMTLDETMRRLAPRLVEGDEIRVAGLVLIAREISNGSVVKAGLKLVK